MFCSKCGNEIKKGDKYCGKCGNKINDDLKRNHIKVIIVVIIILMGIIISALIFINNKNADSNGKLNDSSSQQQNEEMQKVKTNFVYKFNADNTEEYNGGAKNHIANSNQYNWKVDTSHAKLVTITEDMLDIEFVENYNNHNIYHINSKVKDGLIDVHTTKTSFAPNYTITVESKVYNNGLYVFLKDDNTVLYGENLETLKSLI